MCIRDSIDTITENVCEIIVKQTEQICETMIWEENIIIGSTKENTFIINNDNHKEIINIKEVSKIKIKNAYLINRNIPIAGHTHSDKSHKKEICEKHLTYNNYHCNEKRRTIRTVSYTHLDVYKRQGKMKSLPYEQVTSCLLYTSRCV